MSNGGAHLSPDGKTCHNASASVFGWEFQIHAAMVLFIRFLPNADQLIVEGETDDIEIYLSDGTSILCQAKAHFTNDPGEGSSARFSDALKTLKEDCEKADCRQCVYVTNDAYPFGKRIKGNRFGDDTLLEFKELSPDAQEYVIGKANGAVKDMDTLKKKLGVFVLRFYGSDERTRMEAVRNAIQDFLDDLAVTEVRINAQSLRRVWHTLLFENASAHDTKASISKASFIWPIVVQVCKLSSGDAALLELNDSVRSDVEVAYSDLIDDATERFSLVTKIETDFDAFRRFSGTGRLADDRKTFVSQKYRDYFEDLALEHFDEEASEVVARIVLSKILYRLSVIEKVKGKVNLED